MKVTINLEESFFDELVEKMETNIDNLVDEKVNEKVDDSLDDKVTYYMENELNISDHISDWMSSNFDIAEELTHIDLTDEIDINYDDVAQTLLEQYNPINACTTSRLFTEAIAQAIRYLLLRDNEIVESIEKALDKHKKKIDEDFLRATFRQQFIEELNEYSKAKAIEDAQRVIEDIRNFGNTTTTIPLDLV